MTGVVVAIGPMMVDHGGGSSGGIPASSAETEAVVVAAMAAVAIVGRMAVEFGQIQQRPLHRRHRPPRDDQQHGPAGHRRQLLQPDTRHSRTRGHWAVTSPAAVVG